MSTGKQLMLFRRPVARKPRSAGSVTNPSAPKDRSWLKSFIGPEVWALIAEAPDVHGRRREDRKA